jgi:hypothetical protein
MRESVPVHSPHRRTVRHLKICLHCLESQPLPIPFNVKARTLAPPHERDALIVVRMSAAAAASAAAPAGVGDVSAAADAAQSPPRAQAHHPRSREPCSIYWKLSRYRTLHSLVATLARHPKVSVIHTLSRSPLSPRTRGRRSEPPRANPTEARLATATTVCSMPERRCRSCPSAACSQLPRDAPTRGEREGAQSDSRECAATASGGGGERRSGAHTYGRDGKNVPQL